MIKTLSLKRVVATTRKIVKQNPDFIYQAPDETFGCVYFQNNEPSCLVGHVFSKLDIPLDELIEKYNSRYSAYEVCSLYLDGELGIKVADEARNFLDAIQTHQDNGASWQEALNDVCYVMGIND